MNQSENSEKIKICCFLTCAYPLFSGSSDVFGGAEIDLYHIAKGLSENPDLQVTFIVGDYGQPYKEIYGNITVYKIKGYKPFHNRLNYVQAVFNSILFFNRKKFDFYLTKTCSCWYISIFPLLTSLFRKWNTQFIFRSASMMDVNGDFSDPKTITGRIYKFFLRHCAKILVQTKEQQESLFKIENLKSEVVPNAFPFPVLPLVPFTQRKFVLWVGSAQELKRPELFLDLAIKIPQLNFVMILTGNNELKKSIVEKSKVISNLKIIDWVSFHCIHIYFRHALCYVLTSRIEGFPNTIIQSAHSGTPILSFQVNPDNVLSQYNLGKLANNNLEVAIEFLKSLNSENMKKYAVNCQNYAKKHHNTNEIIQFYNKYFKEFYKG